jgi:hypothetical protein
MVECRYISTRMFNIGDRWTWVVSFTTLEGIIARERATDIYWTEGSMVPRADLDALKTRTSV